MYKQLLQFVKRNYLIFSISSKRNTQVIKKTWYSMTTFNCDIKKENKAKGERNC